MKRIADAAESIEDFFARYTRYLSWTLYESCSAGFSMVNDHSDFSICRGKCLHRKKLFAQANPCSTRRSEMYKVQLRGHLKSLEEKDRLGE